MWMRFVKDYFTFTRKERTGIIFFLCIIFIFILIPFLYPLFISREIFSHQQFDAQINLLKIEAVDSSKLRNYAKNTDNDFYDDYTPSGKRKYENIKAESFSFDPNTVSGADWKRLGVRDKTIATIEKYLSKGGRFRKPEDLSKIWGLSPADQQRLIPYVSIKESPAETTHYEKTEYPKSTFSYTPRVYSKVDINLADTTAYIALPGVGSKLSQRIIAFRDRLGGFHSIDQVGETFLLPDSTFQKIKTRLSISDTSVRQININVATVEEMKVHPYLRYNLANAIFQYRQQHGNFNSVEEIKKIMLVTTEVFNKVAPYLSIR